MSFCSPTWAGQVVAGLMLLCLSKAYGQSAGHGEAILFSSPEGHTGSNSVVPAVLAPQPPDHPAGQTALPGGLFNPQPLAPMPLAPPVVMIASGNAQNTTDPRHPLTPAQIMGVPTMEQIFGLPARQNLAGENYPAVSQNGSTNGIIMDGASLGKPAFEQSDWAKIFAGTTATNANHSDNSQDLFGGFFNRPSGHSFFGDDGGNSDDTAFGSPRAVQAPPQQDSSLYAGLANPEGGGSPNPSPGLMNSGFESQSQQPQSPFGLPKSQTVAVLPHLPTVQKAPGQNYDTAPAGPPSWAPKPPPWASSQPVPGTMEPRKF